MNNLIHARRAFHNYSLFIIHYSLFTEKYNAPIYDRGVKIRGTTLITPCGASWLLCNGSARSGHPGRLGSGLQTSA